ncbi:lytic transglycosylase domain-containing protein [Sorangium sp. So ce315]|uniref:lytic transglycosylase domain-containing protein n=1 Tax=Sorangium sp. So ce315 TaxID=3133299 RepID=UPI003F639A3A
MKSSRRSSVEPAPRGALVLGLALSAGGVLLPGKTASAEVFRYVDRDGKAHEVTVHADAGAPPGEPPSAAAAEGEPASGGAVVVAGATLDFPYAEHAREAARLYALPVELIAAVMKVESGFDPGAVSRAGAMGLMQLMRSTALDMRVVDPFDPRQNVLGGARHLRILVNTYGGDLALALAAYHAGPGTVARYGGVPPYPETYRYITRVIALYHRYRDRGIPPLAPRPATRTVVL